MTATELWAGTYKRRNDNADYQGHHVGPFWQGNLLLDDHDEAEDKCPNK